MNYAQMQITLSNNINYPIHNVDVKTENEFYSITHIMYGDEPLKKDRCAFVRQGFEPYTQDANERYYVSKTYLKSFTNLSGHVVKFQSIESTGTSAQTWVDTTLQFTNGDDQTVIPFSTIDEFNKNLGGNISNLVEIDDSNKAFKKIGSASFYNCINLSCAIFGRVSRINSEAFYNCHNLKKLYLFHDDVVELEDKWIFDEDEDGITRDYPISVYVPHDIAEDYSRISKWPYIIENNKVTIIGI